MGHNIAINVQLKNFNKPILLKYFVASSADIYYAVMDKGIHFLNPTLKLDIKLGKNNKNYTLHEDLIAVTYITG